MSPLEREMDKMFDDLPPFTYNSIVKYVRNSGKNIQHSPDYMVMKPFERGVNFFYSRLPSQCFSQAPQRKHDLLHQSPLLWKSSEQ